MIPGSNGFPFLIDEDLITKDHERSKLRSYLTDQRLARYMVEYVRWLYSKFLHNKEEDHSFPLLKKFAEKIVIDEKFEYGPVKKTFSLNSGLTKDGKLYVKSLETKKRLIYTLQLYILYNLDDLKDYHNRTTISLYYKNVSDFTRYRDQVILQGPKAVEEWVKERSRDYTLHSDVITGDEVTPFFFKNPKIRDRIYLAQPAADLSQALQIDLQWDKHVVNRANEITKVDEELPTDDFIVYAYKNPSRVEPYVCQDEDNCRAGKLKGPKEVLVYKNEKNDTVFLSMLPLETCTR